jgi:hypothetical protein
MQVIVNDAIINRLVGGQADGVRRLKAIGLSLAWGLDRVVDADGLAVSLEPEGPLPADHQIERFSLWHWSHRAARPDGVAEWWLDLERQLEQSAPAVQARLLVERLEDALDAAALSGETLPALYTWNRALAQSAPQWERKVMVDRLLNVLERQGNRLSPLLRQLHQEEHLTASDWDPVNRRRYAADPVSFLYEGRHWEALRVLISAGADPVRLNGTTLLDETVRQVCRDLKKGDSPDGEALLLIGDMLTGAVLAPTVKDDIETISHLLRETEHQDMFVAHLRAHRAHVSSQSDGLALTIRKPRQRS